jgi:hypothetical protein
MIWRWKKECKVSWLRQRSFFAHGLKDFNNQRACPFDLFHFSGDRHQERVSNMFVVRQKICYHRE